MSLNDLLFFWYPFHFLPYLNISLSVISPINSLSAPNSLSPLWEKSTRLWIAIHNTLHITLETKDIFVFIYF